MIFTGDETIDGLINGILNMPESRFLNKQAKNILEKHRDAVDSAETEQEKNKAIADLMKVALDISIKESVLHREEAEKEKKGD